MGVRGLKVQRISETLYSKRPERKESRIRRSVATARAYYGAETSSGPESVGAELTGTQRSRMDNTDLLQAGALRLHQGTERRLEDQLDGLSDIGDSAGGDAARGSKLRSSKPCRKDAIKSGPAKRL